MEHKYKICSHCKLNKNLEDFALKKANKSNGRASECKKCFQLRAKKIYQKTKDLKKIKDKERYIKNKDKFKHYSREYYRNNKDVIVKKQILLNKTKYENDINFKISHNLRSRLRIALKRNYKNGSAVRDLGCSIIEFKQYLEAKFEPEMTWENYGINGWHIDHIRPLSSFNLNNKEELLQAVHYTNLQPLWEADNLSKGAKYE